MTKDQAYIKWTGLGKGERGDGTKNDFNHQGNPFV
jgi:hypothetical protein